MYLRALLILLALASSAYAQQPDPQFLQRAISAVQTQRNLALDAQAVAEAKVIGLTEELDKAKTRIRELEATQEPKNGK